jgi:hypothetical protein
VTVTHRERDIHQGRVVGDGEGGGSEDKKGTRMQSTMERNPIVGGCQESEKEPVQKGAIPKIVRFLKDFF